MKTFEFTTHVIVTVKAATLERANELAGDTLDNLADYGEYIESGDITIGEAELQGESEDEDEEEED